jgi:Fe-S cluster assembly iron-binding protein IscA
MFHNPLPRFDVPSYSVHVDRGAHVTFHSDAIARQLIILAPNANDTQGALKSP